MKKVLFIAMHRPDRSPSQRYRFEQYFDYLGGILQGDLGNSFVTKRPVWDEFFSLFPATFELSICAMIFAVVLGLPVFATLLEGRRALPVERAHAGRGRPQSKLPLP